MHLVNACLRLLVRSVESEHCFKDFLLLFFFFLIEKITVLLQYFFEYQQKQKIQILDSECRLSLMF